MLPPTSRAVVDCGGALSLHPRRERLDVETHESLGRDHRGAPDLPLRPSVPEAGRRGPLACTALRPILLLPVALRVSSTFPRRPDRSSRNSTAVMSARSATDGDWPPIRPTPPPATVPPSCRAFSISESNISDYDPQVHPYRLSQQRSGSGGPDDRALPSSPIPSDLESSVIADQLRQDHRVRSSSDFSPTDLYPKQAATSPQIGTTGMLSPHLSPLGDQRRLHVHHDQKQHSPHSSDQPQYEQSGDLQQQLQRQFWRPTQHLSSDHQMLLRKQAQERADQAEKHQQQQQQFTQSYSSSESDLSVPVWSGRPVPQAYQQSSPLHQSLQFNIQPNSWDPSTPAKILSSPTTYRELAVQGSPQFALSNPSTSSANAASAPTPRRSLHGSYHAISVAPPRVSDSSATISGGSTPNSTGSGERVVTMATPVEYGASRHRRVDYQQQTGQRPLCLRGGASASLSGTDGGRGKMQKAEPREHSYPGSTGNSASQQDAMHQRVQQFGSAPTAKRSLGSSSRSKRSSATTPKAGGGAAKLDLSMPMTVVPTSTVNSLSPDAPQVGPYLLVHRPLTLGAPLGRFMSDTITSSSMGGPFAAAAQPMSVRRGSSGADEPFLRSSAVPTLHIPPPPARSPAAGDQHALELASKLGATSISSVSSLAGPISAVSSPASVIASSEGSGSQTLHQLQQLQPVLLPLPGQKLKRGTGISCHHCKTHKLPSEIQFCTHQPSIGKACKKKYCVQVSALNDGCTVS